MCESWEEIACLDGVDGVVGEDVSEEEAEDDDADDVMP